MLIYSVNISGQYIHLHTSIRAYLSVKMGKTYRCDYTNHVENSEMRVSRPDISADTMAVTEIDNLYNLHLFSGTRDISLNEADLWDDFIEDLEEKCTDKIVSQNGKYCSTMYEIPITGTIMLTPYDKTNLNKFKSSQTVTIGGRVYDMNQIYRTTANEMVFKYYCPLYLEKPIFKNDKISQISWTLEKKHGVGYYKPCVTQISHKTMNHKINYGYSHFYSYDTENARDPIVINLQQKTYVTHVGVLNVEPVVKIVKKTKGGRRKRVSSGQLYVYDEENNKEYSFVETFTLSYRDITTEKWVFMGSFTGTVSVAEEKIIDLIQNYNTRDGIVTDGFKIEIGRHRQPHMRLAVYGIPVYSKDEEGQIIGTDKNKTVTYCIDSKNDSKYVPDGKGLYCYKWWHETKNRNHVRKINLKNEITSQIDDMYYFDNV